MRSVHTLPLTQEVTECDWACSWACSGSVLGERALRGRERHGYRVCWSSFLQPPSLILCLCSCRRAACIEEPPWRWSRSSRTSWRSCGWSCRDSDRQVRWSWGPSSSWSCFLVSLAGKHETGGSMTLIPERASVWLEPILTLFPLNVWLVMTVYHRSWRHFVTASVHFSI